MEKLLLKITQKNWNSSDTVMAKWENTPRVSTIFQIGFLTTQRKILWKMLQNLSVVNQFNLKLDT